MSHRLTVDAPAGYNPQGREYDQYLIAKIKEAAVEDLLNIDENRMETAGECGTRSFIMMLGALDGLKLETDIFSYEGPFGVGYLVAKVGGFAKDKENDILDNYWCNQKKGLNNIRQNESDLVRLARQTLEAFVTEKRKINIPEGFRLNYLISVPGFLFQSKKTAGSGDVLVLSALPEKILLRRS